VTGSRGQGLERRADEYTEFGIDMPHFTRVRISNINEISKNRHLVPEPDIETLESNDPTGAAKGEHKISVILQALIKLRANSLQRVLGVTVFW
jgi:hypothetical protein